MIDKQGSFDQPTMFTRPRSATRHTHTHTSWAHGWLGRLEFHHLNDVDEGGTAGLCFNLRMGLDLSLPVLEAIHGNSSTGGTGLGS